MNHLATDEAKNVKILPIVIATVLLTAALVVAVLFSFDLLAFGTDQAIDQLVHTDGMVHTEGMVHSDELHDELVSDRQKGVAERGSMVMPFDLERTTHIFETTEFGGVQQVLSADGDLTQIRLIQDHLKEEVDRFQSGDFGDPAAIHGHDMPGLVELEAGYERIDVTYESLLDGGKITYSTADEELKNAIHRWFEAQLSDHGSHARSALP